MLVVLCPAAVAPDANAQGPPSTDLWMMDLPDKLDAITEPSAVNLTNRADYDNQPHVTPDGSAVLYTSGRDDQTDIFRYDFAAGTHARVTNTSESEYSPTVMPGGERFSVIRVEADDAQRLWSFALDGTDPRLILEDIEPVGYHAWLSSQRVALFVLGSPPTLQVADLTTGKADTLSTDIGRSLLRIPGRDAISFVQKSDTEPWTVRALDAAGAEVTVVAPALPSRDDLAWLPDATMLMADGNTIYFRRPGAEDWQPLASFDTPEIEGITRLAATPDGRRLIFVAGRPESE